MQDNRSLLDSLVAAGRLRFNRADLFDRPAPFAAGKVARERWRGMLLGLAIGDALGNTSEGLLPGERKLHLGEVRDFLPSRRAEGRAVGLPSDDTQLAFWTLEQWLSDGHLDPARLAERFASRPIFGIGQSVAMFVANHARGLEWPEAAVPSAGNGALMRIPPVIVPHLTTGTFALWADTALAAAVTHNDPAAIAASIAFVGILGHLLTADQPPPAAWWVDTFVSLAAPVEGESHYWPRGGLFVGHQGSLAQFVAAVVPPALAAGRSVIEAQADWHSGAYLLETVPTVLMILACHADDPEEAIVRAVNDTVDNDTTAAIVGAAMGALHGEEALPLRWRQRLLGRTAEADDGRVFQLLEETERAIARP